MITITTSKVALPKLRLSKLEVISKTVLKGSKRKIKFMSELAHQRRLIRWVNETAALQPVAEVAESLAWIHSIANGHNRNMIQRSIAMWEGMRAGVLDLFDPFPANDKHGLYIEMKRRDGKTSEDQQRFIAYIQRRGYAHVVANKWTTAAYAIVSYHGLEEHEPIPSLCEDEVAAKNKRDAIEYISRTNTTNRRITRQNKMMTREHKRALKALTAKPKAESKRAPPVAES